MTRILVARASWPVRLAVLVLIASAMVPTVPAEAALEFDIIVRGPGLKDPVTIRWEEIARTDFFADAERPLTIQPPAYDLELHERLPNGEALQVRHWKYYPRATVVSTDDARSPWLRPSMTLKDLLDRKLAGVGSEANESFSWSILGVALAFGLAISSGVALGLKRLRRTPNAAPPSD
jgi:hypothetical protein